MDQQTGKNLPIQMGQVVRRLDNNIPLGISIHATQTNNS